MLLIDNELHHSTPAHRIPKVGAAMGEARGEFLSVNEYGDDFDIWPLRGNLRSLAKLGEEFEKIEPGYYKLIILDAKYRFSVEGVSENNNSAETQVYNLLDKYAAKLRAAILLVHHSSKGGQSDKRVTDVGSGAGAQSRAADCHMVLREHEEPGHMVLDAAVRSFPPVKPLALKWEFPLWLPAEGVDVTQLKGLKTRGEERQKDKDKDGIDAIAKALIKGPATARALRERTPLGKDRLQRLLDGMVYREEIIKEEITVRNNKCAEYRLPKAKE